MMSRLLIRVGELDHPPIIVGPSQKADPAGQVVARKPRRHDAIVGTNTKNVFKCGAPFWAT